MKFDANILNEAFVLIRQIDISFVMYGAQKCMKFPISHKSWKFATNIIADRIIEASQHKNNNESNYSYIQWCNKYLLSRYN